MLTTPPISDLTRKALIIFSVLNLIFTLSLQSQNVSVIDKISYSMGEYLDKVFDYQEASNGVSLFTVSSRYERLKEFENYERFGLGSIQNTYEYHRNEKNQLTTISSQFRDKYFLYDEQNRIKEIQVKRKHSSVKLIYDRLEFIYDDEGRVVKTKAYRKKKLLGENSYQHHSSGEFVKRITMKKGEIISITEIYIQKPLISFNLKWYEIYNPDEDNFNLFSDFMFGFPTQIVCLSEGVICNQQFTYVSR